MREDDGRDAKPEREMFTVWIRRTFVLITRDNLTDMGLHQVGYNEVRDGYEM